MAYSERTVLFKDKPVELAGKAVEIGEKAPTFTVVNPELEDAGKNPLHIDSKALGDLANAGNLLLDTEPGFSPGGWAGDHSGIRRAAERRACACDPTRRRRR